MPSLLIYFILVLLGAAAARAEGELDDRPMLRIEAEMHTSAINSLSVDAACTRMLTGSNDKTARLWSVPEGGQGTPRLLQTFRPPIGEGYQGNVFAVAISPDGKWAAAGGWDAGFAGPGKGGAVSVYIFDTATGQVVARVGSFSQVVLHLVFSADSRFLAITLANGAGLSVWSTEGWNRLAEDKSYGGKDSYGAAFAPDGTLYTVAFDGFIRRYSANTFVLESQAGTQSAVEPFGIALHPDGQSLAVGFNDANVTAIDFYDTKDLRLISRANLDGAAVKKVFGVTWSSDGSRFYAGGADFKMGDRRRLFIWGDGGKGPRSETLLSASTIVGLYPCGQAVAAVSKDPAFGLVDSEGKKVFWREGVKVDMSQKSGDAFTVSDDGSRLRFGLDFGGTNPVLFDLDQQKVIDSPKPEAGLAASKVKGLPITSWDNSLEPALDGKRLAMQKDERSHALSISPDGSRFVIGADFYVRAYNAKGLEVWKMPGGADGVNITANGKLVVLAGTDGTIRWRRLSDGKELLALFVRKGDRRFIAWTPKGYYVASGGGEDLIGWHVNRGLTEAADFFPASRFRDRFNRPDIVSRVLKDLDEDLAIDGANGVSQRKRDEDIRKRLPPVVKIVSPVEGSAFTGDMLQISYNVRSPSNLPITDVSVLVDGRPIVKASNRDLRVSGPKGEIAGLVPIAGLPKRDVSISLLARAGQTDSVPAVIRLKYKGPPSGARPQAAVPEMASLYAVVVGVGKFKDPAIDPIRNASKDAKAFASALRKQEGVFYKKVEIKLLADDDADNGAIIDALEWLRLTAGTGDVAVIYFAGRGVTLPSGDYYLMTANTKMETVGGLSLPTHSTSVPSVEITRTLKDVVSNAVFFSDACHTAQAAGTTFRGGADANRLVNEIASTSNTVVLSSSTGTEQCYDSPELSNGAFTTALLDGLAGEADVLPRDGKVSLDELLVFTKRRVQEVTLGAQHPVDLKPSEVSNFIFSKVLTASGAAASDTSAENTR